MDGGYDRPEKFKGRGYTVGFTFKMCASTRWTRQRAALSVVADQRETIQGMRCRSIWDCDGMNDPGGLLAVWFRR